MLPPYIDSIDARLLTVKSSVLNPCRMCFHTQLELRAQSLRAMGHPQWRQCVGDAFRFKMQVVYKHWQKLAALSRPFALQPSFLICSYRLF